jgi:hypothetical protein
MVWAFRLMVWAFRLMVWVLQVMITVNGHAVYIEFVFYVQVLESRFNSPPAV